MKIYKYTSLNTAVAILKSNGVALNNPKEFNDPNDCDFIQDDCDIQKNKKLTKEYFKFKVICDLVSQNKITIGKNSRKSLSNLKKEIKDIKERMEANPYFDGFSNPDLVDKVITSNPRDVNLYSEKAKEEFQKKIDISIEKEKESALVSCFSKRKDSMLMWSHYANSHKGVCFEYERPNSPVFRDVIYQQKRPFVGLHKLVSRAIALDILGEELTEKKLAVDLEETLEPFFVKSLDWQYEEEVRCIYSKINLDDNIEYDGNRYILNIGYPTAIYIGCKAGGDELDHLYELAQHRGIPVYFMKKSDKTFDVVVDTKYEYKPKDRPGTKEITLLRLVNEINHCLDRGIFLAGFSAALIIPGICSQVECPEISNSKKRYIKWCNEYLPCTSRGPDNQGIPYLSGDVLWKIKEKLFSDGNIDVYGEYEDFRLCEIVLKIEERNHWDAYCDMLGAGSITASINRFCSDMIYQAERCYKKHKQEIEGLSQIPIEDFDAEMEQMNECKIVSERINKHLNSIK